MASTVRVFISYSHDSDEHKKKVKDLSERLRNDGIESRIDQYFSKPAEGWPLWVDNEMTEAAFVLVIFSERYKQYFDKLNEGDVGYEHDEGGYGLSWEITYVWNDWYRHRGRNVKYIAVVLSSSDSNFIPSRFALEDRYYYDKADDYDRLYLRLVKPLLKDDSSIPENGSIEDIKEYLSLEPLGPFPSIEAQGYVHAVSAPISHDAISWLSKLHHNLPPRLSLEGRSSDINNVNNFLKNNKVILLHGEAGVGKSALAVEIAQDLYDRSSESSNGFSAPSFHAFVWIDVGLDGLTLNDLLDGIAETFKYRYILRLREVSKNKEVSKLLAKFPSLIVITNYDLVLDPEVKNYLERLTPNNKVLLTSSKQDLELEPANAIRYNVQTLNDEDAISFAGSEAEPYNFRGITSRHLADICRACKNVPLAIQWAFGWLSQKEAFEASIEEMRKFSGIPTDHFFNALWELLPPLAQQMLKASSLFADPATREAILQICDASEDKLDEMLARLKMMRLLIPNEEGSIHRYGIHRKTRALISGKLQSEPGQENELKRCFIDYFLGYVKEHGGVDSPTAIKRIGRERKNVLWAMQMCQQLPVPKRKAFIEFHRQTYHMLWARDYWTQNLTNGKKAVERTRYSVGMGKELAWIRMESIGWVYFLRAQYDLAQENYKKAKDFFERQRDLNVQYKGLARYYNYQGRLEAAQKDYDKAINLFWQGLRRAEDDVTSGFLESGLADTLFALGDYEAALEGYGAALGIWEKIKDPYRECSALRKKADTFTKLGKREEAQELYEKSFRIAKSVDRIEALAPCYFGLGKLYFASGDRDNARKHLELAAAGFEMLGQKENRGKARALLVSLHQGNEYTIEPGDERSHRSSTEAVVLLVNCPREVTPFRKCEDYRMPLGLVYIASYLNQRGVTTRVLDAEALSKGVSGIVDEAKQLNPRVIGLNCHTLNRHIVYDIVKALRHVVPDAKVILGGAHPALDPEFTFKECPHADGIATGEGERVIYEVFRRPDEIELIPGICYQKKKAGVDKKEVAIYHNDPMPRIQNLDSLALLNTEDLPTGLLELYYKYADPDLPGLWHRAYLHASRGCNFKCSFCTEHTFWRGPTTFRSAESVAKEILVYKERYRSLGIRIENFYFYDDTLTDWLELPKFCDLAQGLGVKWSCSTRIEKINEDLLEQMWRGGCHEIAFGLESGSLIILEKIEKSWYKLKSDPKAEVVRRIRQCTDLGITPRTHFMIGFLWEKRRHIEETVRFALRLKKEASLEDVNFFVVKVYPGTPYHEEMQTRIETLNSDGILEEGNDVYNIWNVYDWYDVEHPKVKAKLRRFNDIPVVSLHPHLDSLSLRRLTRNAYEIFFGDYDYNQVDDHLWRGVDWKD